MKHQVFSEELVASVVKELHVADLENATIGDVLLVASRLEELTGIPFIRMDQGSPGLPANRIGIEAEKANLNKLKVTHAVSQIENPQNIKNARRDIARMMTILHEKMDK